MWSKKIKYDSNKNKGRITNKILDNKKRVRGGRVFSFYSPSQKTMLRPWTYKCFLQNSQGFCDFFKNTLFTEHFWWLLLKIMNSSSYLRVLPIVATIVSIILLQEFVKDFAVCKHWNEEAATRGVPEKRCS